MKEETGKEAETSSTGKVQVNELVMPELPCGMTIVPLGWPIMADAYFSFAYHCISIGAYQDAFEKDCDHDLKLLIPDTAMDKIINDACGIEREVFSCFLDWITKNHWGV